MYYAIPTAPFELAGVVVDLKAAHERRQHVACWTEGSTALPGVNPTGTATTIPWQRCDDVGAGHAAGVATVSRVHPVCGLWSPAAAAWTGRRRCRGDCPEPANRV